jgi:hypothetical protein
MQLGARNFVCTSCYSGVGTFEIASDQMFDGVDEELQNAGLPSGRQPGRGYGVFKKLDVFLLGKAMSLIMRSLCGSPPYEFRLQLRVEASLITSVPHRKRHPSFADALDHDCNSPISH